MMERAALPYVLSFLMLVATASWLLLIGREPICTCGYVRLWHGETLSSENSQHIADWYTPSHIIHGLLFYGALWLVARRLSIGWRLSIATAIECAWEIVENSDAVIDRYRTATISLDYYGDSVVNAASDVLAMMFGFWLARILPIWASIVLIFFFEAATVYLIRDGLALNVLMLLAPMEAIMEWQQAR